LRLQKLINERLEYEEVQRKTIEEEKKVAFPECVLDSEEFWQWDLYIKVTNKAALRIQKSWKECKVFQGLQLARNQL